MMLASEVKEGSALQIDGRIYKVLEVVRHSGSGQMHGFIELKLRDLRFGHFADRRFKHSDKLETVELTRRPTNYLYSDADACYFMDPETFNQVTVPRRALGSSERFLREGTRVTVEILGEEAITVVLPKIVELAVTATGPGIREGQESTLKPATLENGLEIHVPQFIATGDTIRVDTEKLRYVDRITGKKV